MGAELNPEKFTSASGATLLATIQNDWPRAEAAFQQLRDFIENQLKLYSDKVVRSYGSFIPIFDYLYQNPKPEEGNRLLMRAYYYKSQLFNWYGSRHRTEAETPHRHSDSLHHSQSDLRRALRCKSVQRSLQRE
jgi:hypothetical protein